MRIELSNRHITYTDNDRVVCFENDNEVVDFVCVVDNGTENWKYKLDVKSKISADDTFYNTISLKPIITDKEVGVTLKAGMLPRGKCVCEIRQIHTNGQVKVSDCFEVWVKKSVLSYCCAYQENNFIPSEFYQIEQQLDEVNNHPPIVDESGFWRIYEATIGEYVLTDIPAQGQTILTGGEGITVSNDRISVKTDNKTISVNAGNELYVSEVDGGYI